MIWLGIKTKQGKKPFFLGDPETGKNALELHPELKNHLVLTLLPRPGTPSTKPGCSKSCPT